MTSALTESIRWAFFGVQYLNGNRPVQEWYDGLSEAERDEVHDTMAYLQVLPIHLWIKPEYAPLGDGLSEIRCKVTAMNKVIRIYGFFHPSSRRHSFTLLVGREKKVSNDRDGKKEAISRMRRIERKEATTHDFEF